MTVITNKLCGPVKFVITEFDFQSCFCVVVGQKPYRRHRCWVPRQVLRLSKGINNAFYCFICPTIYNPAYFAFYNKTSTISIFFKFYLTAGARGFELSVIKSAISIMY
jgi:hypothetical protein